MKKVYPFLLLVLFLLSAKSVLALENLGDFVIDDYVVNIDIQEDGKIEVQEKIEVDFSQPHHGIFREIPYKYKNKWGQQYHMRFSDIEVRDENGAERSFERSTESGNVILKIGDADKFVEGRQVYVIDYEVDRGMRFFDEYDEFYWNPIGTGWPTTINSAMALVRLPKSVELNKEDIICFTGSYGSTEQDCSGHVGLEEINFKADGPLDAREGLTVAIKFPKGYIPEPTFWDSTKYFLMDNWGYLIPMVIFLFMYWLWRDEGREIDLNKTVIAQYEPPRGMTPGEMGYLMREISVSGDVSADLVNLAVKGYLQIIELEKKKYKLKKIKEWGGRFDVKSHEARLLKGLFDSSPVGKEIELSKVKSFYQDVQVSNEKLKKEIKKKSYFYRKVLNARSMYFTIGSLVFMASIFLGSILQRFDILFGGIASGLIIIIFGIFMSKKTRQGAEAYWHIQGFKEYIKTAERYRVKFQEEQNLFEKYLPYAMVFGLADKWAKAFEGIIEEPPDWYRSTSGDTFSPRIFAGSMSSFSSRAAGTATPPRSSSSGFSGGGFSGGGGGGGGGGSW